MSEQPERLVYTVAEAAKLTGYSRCRLYEKIRAKQLPAYQNEPGAEFRIFHDDLVGWLKRVPAEKQPARNRQRRVRHVTS